MNEPIPVELKFQQKNNRVFLTTFAVYHDCENFYATPTLAASTHINQHLVNSTHLINAYSQCVNEIGTKADVLHLFYILCQFSVF